MLRKILSSILILILAVGVIPASASGDLSVNLNFDELTSVLTVTGNAKGQISIALVKGDISSVSVSNPPADFKQIYSYGTYKVTFTLPVSLIPGKYTVYVYDKENSANSGFEYFNTAEADKIVSQLDLAADYDAFAAMAKPKAEYLGIDTQSALYKACADSAYKLMYSLDKTFVDSINYRNKFYLSLAVSGLNGASMSDAEAILQEYETYLGISYANDYTSALSSDRKSALCRLLATADYTKGLSDSAEFVTAPSFADYYKYMCIAAAANSALGWRELQNIYTDEFKAELKPITDANSKYDSYTPKAIYSEMTSLEFTDIASLTDNLDTAVKKAAADNSYNPGGNNSSHGLGSSAGAVPSVTLPTENTDTSYDTTPDTEANPSEEAFSISLPKLNNEANSYFSDVTSGHWAYSSISSMSDAGIISGYTDGTFKPDSAITRAEFTKLIVSAFALKGKRASFNDVFDTDWHYPYVSVAAGTELILGSGGSFNPDNQILRQDAALIIYRVSKLFDLEYVGKYEFSDFNDTSLYAWAAVSSLASEGIISGGGDNKFKPLDTITRAETAALIYKTINRFNEDIGGDAK